MGLLVHNSACGRMGPSCTPKNIAFEKDKNEMSFKQCVKRVQCHHIASTCQMLIPSK
jgi:hypothetical protein